MATLDVSTLDVSTTARRLVMQHGLQARTYADCRALEDFLCGDVEASEGWERVSVAVEALLESHPVPRRVAA
jgi:hypothetical protein